MDKNSHSSAGIRYLSVDVPFESRHQCWFCGEPWQFQMQFPQHASDCDACPHPGLRLPACKECRDACYQSQCMDIEVARYAVKQALAKRYRKHLAIGHNWTKEELEQTGWDDKILGGFRQSGWKMFEIARDRLRFTGWPLVADGQVIEVVRMAEPFHFRGVDYPSQELALTTLAAFEGIAILEFSKIVKVVGIRHLDIAIDFSRRIRGMSKTERDKAISELEG